MAVNPAVPIAIVPFAGEANYPYPLTGIVGADLVRSGLFKLIDPTGAASSTRAPRALTTPVRTA